VRKRFIKLLFIIYLSLCLASFATAYRLNGSLKGKITDTEGFPLPGAFVYVSSPDLLGIRTYITSDTGTIRLPSLPPGQYKIMVEMPGFKAVNIENIIIRIGKTTTINITLEMTNIEEEITMRVPTPTADVESAKIAHVMEMELLNKIPLTRDLSALINSVSGVLSESIYNQQTHLVHGSSARSNIYSFEGANLSDTVGMHLLTDINFDVIKEIELETAAHPAEIGNIDGGFINVVTKSGQNKTNGEVILYHGSEKTASNLWPEEELSAAGVSSPPLDKSLWDFSFSLGGAFLEDRLWFFGNARYLTQKRTTPFLPWTDPLGKNHEEYSWKNNEILGLFKLTGQFSPQLRISGLFSYVNRYRPASESPLSWNLTEEATRIMDHEKNYTLSGTLNYVIDQNTFIDLRAGYVNHHLPLLLKDQGVGNPQYFNEGTGHTWGSAQFNEIQKNRRFQGGAYLTRFQDNFLGGNHELKLGGEYEYSFGEWSTWKEDNLLLDYYYGDPYYYGDVESPTTGNPIGKGRIYFYIAGKAEGILNPKTELRRLGFFLQNTATFASRLTLSFGLRFDRSTSRLLPHTKEASGNPVSINKIGEELIKPLYGINPFDINDVKEWADLMVWNSLSPRLGLSFDIYGNGKMVFKASYARYTEYLMLQYVYPLNPFYPGRLHQFFWYDENMDGNVDIEDSYDLFPEDYSLYLEESYKKRIDPDIKSPYLDEFTIGLQQELFKDFCIRINGIYKVKRNIIENVRYAPALDKDWYAIEEDTEGWWIPFNTVVPAVDDYPDTRVEVYFWSKDAPLAFDRIKNVPELERKYQALEFVLKKRMSNNWQLHGSIILSKSSGNIGQGYNASSGFSSAGESPNYFVNLTENSVLDYDRPLVIKLMGTYRFPYEFYLSFFYTHMSGIPWARRVTIYPPSAWSEEENAYSSFVDVLLEEPGTRRNNSYDNLNLRIEKEFKFKGKGRISLYIDIFNALGNKYRSIIQNDGGFWFPSGENTTEGIRILNSNYKRIVSVTGVRTFRLSLHFKF
jgi:hypothetical protein